MYLYISSVVESAKPVVKAVVTCIRQANEEAEITFGITAATSKVFRADRCNTEHSKKHIISVL